MKRADLFKWAMVFIFLAFVIIGCSPSSIPSVAPAQINTPTIAPTKTITPLPSPTPTPILLALTNDTSVYAGPEDDGFEQITEISNGTSVEPLAKFGGFIQIRLNKEGNPVEGFIPALFLEQVSQDLPDLSVDEVPWKVDYILATNEKPIEKENTKSYFVEKTLKTKTTFQTAFEVRVEMQAKNPVGVLFVAEPGGSSIWWKDQKRIEIFCEEGNMNLLFRDGTTEGGCYGVGFPAIKTEDKTICNVKLRFDQYGKNVDVIDASGETLDQIAIEHMGEFPGGLFPDGIVRLTNIDLSPNSIGKISYLVYYIPPDGVYTK